MRYGYVRFPVSRDYYEDDPDQWRLTLDVIWRAAQDYARARGIELLPGAAQEIIGKVVVIYAFPAVKLT